MTAAAIDPERDSAGGLTRLGRAWICLALALAVHVMDEAMTGFLSVYNPTVQSLRARFGFWPMPTLEFGDWIGGQFAGVIVLLALSPVVFRGARWIRPIFYFLAVVVGLLNALGHTLGTIFGQTVSTVHFARPAPGFYSSPLLALAAVHALVQLRRTRSRE